MALTDIDLANLDTKPFFQSQIKQLVNLVKRVYPESSPYFFVKDVGGEFTLQKLGEEIPNVFDIIPPEVPGVNDLLNRDDQQSRKIGNLENAAMFSSDPTVWASESILSPINNEERLAGFLITLVPLAVDPDTLDLGFFDQIAESMGTSSITSNLVEKYKERSDHLSVMLEVNTHLNIAATKTDFLYEISRFGKYFLQFDRAVLTLHPEETPEYFIVDSIEGDEAGLQRGMSYPMFNSLVSRAMITGQHCIYRKSQKTLADGIYRTGDFEDQNYKQVIVFPLAKVKNGPGALVLESHEEYPIKQGEITIFEMISQNLGAALTRFSLYERLNNYATIDTLTHLYNLRALKQRFEEELARSKRYQTPMVVLFLDLDKFKLVNDTYGHLMGDYVLKETSQIIRESVRTSDVPGRYGGEEFVVIMLNTTAESCMAVAQRICTAISEYKYEMNQIQVENHISIGLSEYPRDGETMEELIHSADAAMYTAKRRGGDQVVKYEKGMVPKSKQ